MVLGVSVVPIADMKRRAPEQGRIRYGVRTAKAMKAIDRARFTSSDKEAIEAIAGLYGGDVKPFDNQRGTGGWEVIVTQAEIPVLLPPDPLSGTPIYEMWSGGGLQRRCDGETCEIAVEDGDGYVTTQRPCMCAAAKAMACKPITRLNVILPEIRFGGTWRLECKGWNAAHELPGMVEMIQSLQAKGLARAMLAFEKRTTVKNGRKNNFIVPVLRLAGTPEQLAAGALSVGAIAALGPAQADTEAGETHTTTAEMSSGGPSAPSDDDIVDAEIVDDEWAGHTEQPSAMKKMFVLLREAGIDAGERAGFALSVSGGRTSRTSQLSDDELERINRVLHAVASGAATYKGIAPNGRALVEVGR